MLLILPFQKNPKGDPIQVIHSVDENGNNVEEKIYFVPDSSDIEARSSSGSEWFKNEKFVSNPSGGNNGKMATVSDEEVTSGTGKHGGIFNKYAYVTYSFNATNGFGVVQHNSVTIQLSESGNQI